MATAEDVERQLELARMAVLKARACWGEWISPPPDFEPVVSDEEYLKRRPVDDHAGKAEHELRDALEAVQKWRGDGKQPPGSE